MADDDEAVNLTDAQLNDLTHQDGLMFEMDRDAASAFFNTVYDEGDIFEIRTFPAKGSRRKAKSNSCMNATAGEISDAHWRYMDASNAPHTAGVYVCVNPLIDRPVRYDGSKWASDYHVKLARCLYVDFDDCEPSAAPRRIAAAGLPEPTLLVHSGRSNGTHAYWRLDAPITDMDLFSRLQLRLIALVKSDDKIFNPSRVMRVPGSYNYGRQNSCRPLKTGPRYKTWEDLGITPVERETFTPRVYDGPPNREAFNSCTRDFVSRSTPLPEGGDRESRHRGGRNDRTFAAAMDFHANRIPFPEALEELLRYACDRDGLPRHEARTAIRRAYENYSPTPSTGAADYIGGPVGSPLDPASYLGRVVRRGRGMAAADAVAEDVDTIKPARWVTVDEFETTAGDVVKQTTIEYGDDVGDMDSIIVAPDDVPRGTLAPVQSVPIISNVSIEMRVIAGGGKRAGGSERVNIHRGLIDIVESMREAIGEWPKYAPGMGLFGYRNADEDTEEVYPLVTRDELFAFLKRVANVQWVQGEVEHPDFPCREDKKILAITQAEFFAHLSRECPVRHIGVSQIHHEPVIEGMFYPARKRYTPKMDATPYFDELLDRLNPDTEFDRVLLRSMFMTPGWGGPFGSRPLFVLSSDYGQGSGKSETAKVLCDLWGDGDSGWWMNPENSWDQNMKAMMSSNGWLSRCVVIDNVKGKFSGSAVEASITARKIVGHRMYVGSVARPNDATFVLTYNQPNLSRDIATRAVVVKLGRPQASPFASWWPQYMSENRVRIQGEIHATLARMADGHDLGGHRTRWHEWVAEVLCNACRPDEIDDVLDRISARREAVDSDTAHGVRAVDAIVSWCDANAADRARGNRSTLPDGCIPLAATEIRIALLAAGLWAERDRNTSDAVDLQRCIAWTEGVVASFGVMDRARTPSGRPRGIRVDSEGRVCTSHEAVAKTSLIGWHADIARRVEAFDLEEAATGPPQSNIPF